MKKRLYLSLILASLLIVGCGSGKKDKEKDVKHTIEDALKIGEVVYNTPKDIDFNNKTRLNLKRGKNLYNKILKLSNSFQKGTAEDCNISGTVDVEYQNDGTLYMIYNECIYPNNLGLKEYIDGTMSFSGDGSSMTFDYIYASDYDNNYGTYDYYDNLKMSTHSERYIKEFIIDGVYKHYKDNNLFENMSFNNLIMKENNQTNAFYFKGGFSDKIRCFNENHIYETDSNDWLVESPTNSNYYQSGTIYVDATQYKYHGDMVTVRKGERVGEFKQQDLIDELNKKRNGEDCNI